MQIDIRNIYHSMSAFDRAAGPQTQSDKKTNLDTQPLSPSTPLHDVASKYDVRNMSTDDVSSMAEALYRSGEISVYDKLFIQRGALFEDMGLPNTITKADGLGNRDWIVEFEKQLEAAEKYDAPRDSVQQLQNALNLFNRIDGAKNGPLDLTIWTCALISNLKTNPCGASVWQGPSIHLCCN